MKILVNNSEMIFSKFELNKIGELTLTGLSSTATFTGSLSPGDYYLTVVSSSSTNLSMSYQLNGDSYLIKTINTSDFGTPIKITMPETDGSLSTYWQGRGDYTVEISQVAKYEKIAEIEILSNYTSNKILSLGTVNSELASLLGQYDTIYAKISDSNNLIFPNRGYSMFKYENNTFFNYKKEFLFGTISKLLNVPIEGNIKIQGWQAVAYTGVNGDTTIKIEFYRKVA